MMRAADHLDASFPASFIGFTCHCEAYCVAGCCGLDAFSFDDSTLEGAIKAYGVTATELMCAESQQAALQFSHETRQCWSSEDDFNAKWDNGSELSKWILEIIGDTRRLTQKLIQQADAGDRRSAGA